MSILSTDTKRSTSSLAEEAPSISHTSNHGPFLQPPRFSQSSSAAVSRHIASSGSLKIADSQCSLPVLNKVPGLLAAAAAESGQSSEKVNEVETPNEKRNLPHHTSKQSSSNSAEQGLGDAKSRGKWAASSISLQGQEASGSISTHGSAPQASGKKSQMTNGNYLLNFHYDPISRSQPRAPCPPRRKQKIKPYNKDLFLQANYRFVLLKSEFFLPESMDPCKMLRWEDIICLKYSTPDPVQCPICLDYPLCPQITSCGHIYCFPCILRYLFMGQGDHKGECWKKCPLCFMMICSKDLHTIYIEHVKSYNVGDTIEFMLLTRQKDSNILSYKEETEAKPSCNDEIHDLFSKFTFTYDVDLSVRKAISDLDSWLVKADSAPIDDLEKLPYVCAAMEQLEQRKKYWSERRVLNSNIAAKKLDEGALQTVDAVNSLEVSDRVFDNFVMHINGDPKEKDLYNFYQAVDGQHLILHPLNMKCLLHYYGGYTMLPDRINGKILQLETVTQSEAIRRRYRYLSHFSLTTTFQLCEIDLSGLLPPGSLAPFMDEIKKREKQRKRLARKEQMEKTDAEAAIAHPVFVPFSLGDSSYQNPPEFSINDFEALGSPALTSSPPTLTEKKSFSSVTKLGFAAAHDSPALNIEGAHSLHNFKVASNSGGGKNGDQSGPSTSTGSRNPGMESFANVTSRDKSGKPKMNESGKKGKKATRVLLSTAGGRRY